MFDILLNPGPTNTGFMTKLAQWLSSDKCHRTGDFSQDLESLQKSLLERFDSCVDNEIAIMGGSGTTALDSMISSLVPPNTIVINAGTYGQRAEDICKTYKIDYSAVESKTIDDLKVDLDAKFVYFVENETSTGEKYEIERMSKIYPNAKFFIDATSAFGATDYSATTDRIAAISFCSNKCLQSTPGLGVVIWDKRLHIYKRSFYGDLLKYGIGKMPFTIPVQSVGALNQAMKDNNNKSLFDSRSTRLIQDFEKMNISCLSKNPCNSIIAFKHPTRTYDELQNFLKNKGIVIYSGVSNIENSFRVATMSKKFDRKYNKILGAFRDSCIY